MNQSSHDSPCAVVKKKDISKVCIGWKANKSHYQMNETLHGANYEP